MPNQLFLRLQRAKKYVDIQCDGELLKINLYLIFCDIVLNFL